jgi:hypothetical protein
VELMTRKVIANLAFYALSAWVWFTFGLFFASFVGEIKNEVEVLIVASGGALALFVLAGALSWWARVWSGGVR